MSPLTIFRILSYETNNFHVSVGLFIDGGQKTSKHGKDKSDELCVAMMCPFLVLAKF